MPDSAYPTYNLHLPAHKSAIAAAQWFSVSGGVVLLFAAFLLLFDWLGNLHIFAASFNNLPTILALITSSIAIFFYKKSNKFQLLGILLILLGAIMVALNFSGMNFNLIKNGIFFLLIGLSLVASIMKIPHRYHFMQIIALPLLILSMYSFLARLYNFVASGTPLDASSWEAVIFFILCQSILFIKPDRGFVGLFMTESRSGQMARMSLLYFMTLPLCLGFVFLIMDKMNLFDVNGRLAFIVTSTILASIVIMWINIRLLYSSEVEHFLMKESLRVNNITLEMNASDLSTQMSQLEKEKAEVAKKLNNQETLVDLLGNS